MKLPEIPQQLLPNPTALYDRTYVPDADAYLNDQWVVLCYACRAHFGYVQLLFATHGGPVIGCRVYIDPRMVERAKPHSGLPRFGVPEDVRRGARPRHGFDPSQLRMATSRPFWAHCPKCNRGMRVAPLRDLA